MSRQYSKDIFHAQKNILVDGQHFVALPLKLNAAAFTAAEDGSKIVPAGTIVSAAGAPINDGTAYGILYTDCDLSYGNETGSVLVHAVVKKSEIDKVQVVADTAKAALVGIRFE